MDADIREELPMKFAEKPRIELLYKVDNIVIPCQKGQTHAMNDFLRAIDDLDLSKDYDVKIAKKKIKRSLDANAYLWVLIGKLGEKLHRSDKEIYREYIKDNGVFQIVPIREDAIPRWKQIWEGKGMGWVCDDIGACRNIPGYHNMKCFFGSSTYNTAEMARLIDAVVDDCKDQGIETLTPDEIARLKSSWGGD